jgi:hypothetical protein
MRARLAILVAAGCTGCLTAALTGCLRSGTPKAEEAPAAVPIVRGQSPEAAEGADVFAFPDDRGGKLLAQTLAPSDATLPRAARVASRSRHARPPHSLEHPELAPDVELPSLARPVLLSRPAVTRPRGLLDEPVPNEAMLGTLPEPPAVPDGIRIRVASPIVEQPVPLPPLAGPLTDRAPADDPTVEQSTAAALAEAPPMRSRPAPFLRLVLPDPYENRAAVRLRTPFPEDPNPPAAVPRRPGR